MSKVKSGGFICRYPWPIGLFFQGVWRISGTAEMDKTVVVIFIAFLGHHDLLVDSLEIVKVFYNHIIYSMLVEEEEMFAFG